ncbi:bacterial Ig-like domain-containing protein [uncultured Bacteroides sp.]|uniref:bacterial Ig-like domain-containing protein n=1 Tax=uncultured Bacteroides sp. TaxID=162156 RepID=UPI0025F96B27|nr:bacterial Ig-like domain-containing protein [uncultured Bacteroides sp.]
MRLLNKIAHACCYATLGLLALTSCTDGSIYEVNAPDWISDKIQEIEDSKKEPEDEELEGMMEDVYSFGNTDFTSGFWSAFSKYYVIPDGEKWNAVFNLHINPTDNTYYKNFALILTNDVDRGGEGYTEYGAIRFDNDPNKNSEWGDHINRQYVSGTLMFSSGDDDLDANVQALAGKVTLTVDRTNENAFTIKITNSAVTKTYAQPYKEENLNADASNTNIRCFLVPDGSFIDFQQTNIEPIGGLTSALDKNPVSMELQNVPDQVVVGSTLEEAMANISAIVTFEEGVTKTVPVSDLHLSAIPDMDEPGMKTLIAIYNKTFKGENCEQPIVANATFEMVEQIVSIEVTALPSRAQYYYYTSEATQGLTDRTLSFDPTGMVVTATYSSGQTREVDHARLNFSVIPAKAGSHTVTITPANENGISATVEVTVAESTTSAVNNSTNLVGAEDNSTGFWGAFSDDFNVPTGETKQIIFTNYSNLAGNWNNFIVILRKADMTEYAVVRADNYGWGNGYNACIHNGTQGDWGTWLAGMNGAKVTVYVTNCGNGTADIQAVMEGTTSSTSTQYYLGINTVEPSDLNFALTVDSCHLVFNE